MMLVIVYMCIDDLVIIVWILLCVGLSTLVEFISRMKLFLISTAVFIFYQYNDKQMNSCPIQVSTCKSWSTSFYIKVSKELQGLMYTLFPTLIMDIK